MRFYFSSFRAEKRNEWPRRSLEGLTLWTEHVLRVGGAQSLAIAGWDTWTIQLVGRWSTEAVLGYVRLALLALSLGPHEHPRVLRWAHSWAPLFQDRPSWDQGVLGRIEE